MSRRYAFLALIVIVLAGQTGCCLHGCWPCGPNWCGPECGQFFWHEWFSFPPPCCEPCNCCGDYVCSHNPYVRHGGPPMGPRCGCMLGGPGHYAPYDGAPYSEPQMQPTPAEELPAAAAPSASAHVNEFGQTVSYNAPVDSPPASRRLGLRQPRDIAR